MHIHITAHFLLYIPLYSKCVHAVAVTYLINLCVPTTTISSHQRLFAFYNYRHSTSCTCHECGCIAKFCHKQADCVELSASCITYIRSVTEPGLWSRSWGFSLETYHHLISARESCLGLGSCRSRSHLVSCPSLRVVNWYIYVWRVRRCKPIVSNHIDTSIVIGRET